MKACWPKQVVLDNGPPKRFMAKV